MWLGHVTDETRNVYSQFHEALYWSLPSCHRDLYSISSCLINSLSSTKFLTGIWWTGSFGKLVGRNRLAENVGRLQQTWQHFFFLSMLMYTAVLATPCLAVIFTPLNSLEIRFSLLYMTSVTPFDGRYFKWPTGILYAALSQAIK